MAPLSMLEFNASDATEHWEPCPGILKHPPTH
jgi:hypothetical protein